MGIKERRKKIQRAIIALTTDYEPEQAIKVLEQIGKTVDSYLAGLRQSQRRCGSAQNGA